MLIRQPPSHMVAVVAIIYQKGQPSAAQIVQSDPSKQGRHCARTKTKCGSNKVERRGWPQEGRERTGESLGTGREFTARPSEDQKPPEGGRATVTGLRTGGLWFVHW